ncbi:unnamed protein product [Closterium sp. Naga37s-1]|nr:unnamed protein product [Closterium sp. Naga37s-1]
MSGEYPRPVSANAAAGTSTGMRAAADEAVTRAWVGGLRVLVVDDTPVNLLVARRSLARWGALVTTANHGQQAVDLIAAGLQESSLARWGARVTTAPRGEQAVEMIAAGVEGGRGEEEGRGQQEARGEEAGAVVGEREQEVTGAVGELVRAGDGGAGEMVDSRGKGMAAGELVGSMVGMIGIADSRVGCGARGARERGGDERGGNEGGRASSLQHGFDLVLMDLQMPGMDGFAATEAIRALERKLIAAAAVAAASLSAQPVPLRVPIVALTADVDRGVVQRCAEGGFDGVLQKPVDANLLAAHLSQITFHRSLGR